MARVKRGVLKNKRRKKILKLAKGFRNSRSTKYKQAKQGVIRAGQHAFAHRRKKKRVMRKHWQIIISYAVQNLQGLSYSRFIDMLTKAGISVDRKVMAQMIQEDPEAFGRLVESVTGEKNTGTIPAMTVVEEKPKKVAEKVEKTSEKKAKKEAVAEETVEETISPSEADDLTKIEGVGPKIAETLVVGGISTFADLAKADVAAVSEMIKDIKGNHAADTWPQQAQLAADGKWDELKAWQDELDGGKEA
jgi:ribosomal protein L20